MKTLIFSSAILLISIGAHAADCSKSQLAAAAVKQIGEIHQNPTGFQISSVAPQDTPRLGFKPIVMTFQAEGSNWVAQFNLDDQTCALTFTGDVKLVPVSSAQAE